MFLCFTRFLDRKLGDIDYHGLEKLIPAIEELKKMNLSLSIDTQSAKVAKQCLRRGAEIINDISALSSEKMAKICAKEKCKVILMHMRGTPKTMQEKKHYNCPWGEIVDEMVNKAAYALQNIIRAAVSHIPEDSKVNGLLIMRDGRLFEKENHSFYRQGFGLPVSLIEVRKRRNPPILTGEFPGIPVEPMFAELPQKYDSHVAMVVTLPAAKQKQFGQVMKIHWRDKWNELSLESRDIAAVITALVHAPGLGNKEHSLPAPIYWADGIAGASENDLRFRGQKTTLI